MQLQERTLNTAAWFVNTVAYVKMRALTRQARMVLVQLAKYLKVCEAGSADAVAYIRGPVSLFGINSGLLKTE